MNDDRHRGALASYSAAWGPVTDEERRRLLAESTHADIAYIDPNVACADREALIAYMQGFQSNAPGWTFVVDELKQHHDQGLWHWRMLDADGVVQGVGISAGAFRDGLITRATGFFDAPTGGPE